MCQGREEIRIIKKNNLKIPQSEIPEAQTDQLTTSLISKNFKNLPSNLGVVGPLRIYPWFKTEEATSTITEQTIRFMLSV